MEPKKCLAFCAREDRILGICDRFSKKRENAIFGPFSASKKYARKGSSARAGAVSNEGGWGREGVGTPLLRGGGAGSDTSPRYQRFSGANRSAGTFTPPNLAQPKLMFMAPHLQAFGQFCAYPAGIFYVKSCPPPPPDPQSWPGPNTLGEASEFSTTETYGPCFSPRPSFTPPPLCLCRWPPPACWPAAPSRWAWPARPASCPTAAAASEPPRRGPGWVGGTPPPVDFKKKPVPQFELG